MGLFSKSKRAKDGLADDNAYNNSKGILPLEAQNEDDFWDFSPMNVQNKHSDHALTANEILGKEEPAKEAAPVAEASPLAPSQRLFDRMVNGTPEIKIDVQTEQDNQSDLSDVVIKRNISLSEELNGLIAQISQSNKEKIKSASPDIPVESTQEVNVANQKETPKKSTFDTGVFKRFFMDENGKSAEVEKKPLYTLDSVESILAEAEKNAEDTVNTLIAEQKSQEIEMASSSQEFHYYADEDTTNLKALDDFTADTVYSPIATPKQSKSAVKPKREKSKFSVSIDSDLETSNSDEYVCLDDAARIRAKLKKRSGKIGLRLFLTLIVELVSILFLFVIPQNLIAKPLLNLISTILLCIVNFNSLTGFSGIFKSEKQTELPLAFAMCAAVIHSVCSFALKATEVPYLCVLLGALQIFALIGKRDKYKRIFRNFRTIANNKEKFAVELINDNNARTMVGDSIDGDILLAAGRKTVNVNDFIKHSYSPAPHGKIVPVCSFVALLAAAALFGYTFYINGDAVNSLTAFALTIILGCPLSVMLIGTLPLWLASKKLGYYHAMLAGHSSAEALSQVNAVAVDCFDIFPKGSVQLGGMKPLSPNKLDETILYAAVLCEAANNPLGPVFRKIANTATEEPKAPLSDSIKYEYRMGLSGWVNDCQLLIGNRTLMEAHSIAIPDLETDRALLQKGFFPVYVARDGDACGLFAVRYKPNREITYELRRLCNSGITLVVNANDPNITADMICDYFGLYKECVKVMRTDGTLAYKESTNYQESTSAHAAYTNSVCGLVGAVSAANKIKSLTVVMYVLYIIFSVLGIGITAALAILGNLNTMTTVYALLFQLLGVLCGLLPPYLSRP